MRQLTASFCLIFTLFLFSAASVWSADFNKGMQAYLLGDYTTALREWEPLGIKGNALAQNNLGVMYEEGEGVPKDYKAAKEWYALAADQGVATAQKNLGELYQQGWGVKQDYKSALKWYELAAEQGNVDAQYNLAVMYANGHGVNGLNNKRRARIAALFWSKIAFYQGHENAEGQARLVAQTLTNREKEETRKLIEDCIERKYIGCSTNPQSWLQKFLSKMP